MKTKREKPLRAVGDTLVGLGAMLCILSVIIAIIATNGALILGGCTLGLLMVIAGYLQRISAVLLSKIEAPSVAASETSAG